MALTVTSLNGAIAIGASQIRLTAFTNPVSTFGQKVKLLVDGEFMDMGDASLSPTLTVVRGTNATKASAHNTLAPVTYGLATDFTSGVSSTGTANVSQFSIAVNDANVTLPVTDCTIYLTKAGVLALTINGPNKDQTNTIKMVSLTANAHLITYTDGWYANTTGSDVATFPTTAGAVFTFVARNGLWNAEATADDGVLIG